MASSARAFGRVAFLIFLGVFAAIPAAAQVFPAYLNYQGKLGDPSGNPLTGQYSFQFDLYDQATGGTLLFSDANYTGASNVVQVVNGLYSVQIGSLTAGGIPVSAFFNSEVWLEIHVNAGTSLVGAETLTPRERLTTSPFAFLASNAKYLGTGVNIATFTAAGSLQLVSGSTITSNGSLSISTAASAALTGMPAVFIDQSGNVGLGTNAPGASLDVRSPSGVGVTYAMIVATGSLASQQIVTISTMGVITAAGGVTYGGDLAELYPSAQALEPGDVVALAGGRSVRAASGLPGETLLGVVSTKPGVTLGLKDLPKSEHAVAVALLGRVPVKISLENGPIAPGDMLSASPKRAGYAMKAQGSAWVVAVALEPCKSDGGKALAFVRPYPWVATTEVERLRREVRELSELVRGKGR